MYLMFFNSGDEAASFLELCWLLENSLVDSLEDARFLNLSRRAQVDWLLLRLVFFHRQTPD